VSTRALIALWASVTLLALLLLIQRSSAGATAPRATHARVHTHPKAHPEQTATVKTPPVQSAGPSPQPNPPSRHATRRQIASQDTFQQTATGLKQLRGQQRAAPAYQHLPYRTDEVRIDIVNVTSDGRVVLEVSPLGLNVNPRLAYRHFLARYHDPGSDYLARYERYQP
jgi:hypothetical protein